jgi:filamentous hemagglutinin family protein
MNNIKNIQDLLLASLFKGGWGDQILFNVLLRIANFSIIKTIVLFSELAILFSSNNVLAQITPDETLGAERSVITPNVNIKGAGADQIDGGAIRGSNIFHSFSEFNIKDGQRVYFSNPLGINNILGRVTGNNLSNILGTLGVNGNANLFIINPNGMIFGKNASLDVGSSFYATTASSIKFGEQGEFSATNPQAPEPLLTINPSAFFFKEQTNPGSIINQSRVTKTVQGTPTDGLQVPNGQTLLLLGGNVTIDDGRLIARGGRVEIGAVGGTGSIGLNQNGSLNFPDTIKRADIEFNNRASANRSGIDVRSNNGGDIGITANNITLRSGSQLRAGIASSLGSKESLGGDLIVNATGEVRMTGDDTRMANDIRENAIGKAGNIKLKTNSLVVTDGAQLSSSTFGIGDGGNVVITAERVLLSGARADERGASAIYSRVERPAKGNGGTVQILTKVLEVNNGAEISSQTNGNGSAGNIFIEASERAKFDGSSPSGQFFSGAYSAFNNVAPDAEGKGGDINIITNFLSVINDGLLSASTFGKGGAGSININTEHLLIDNQGLIAAITAGVGNAGSIDIKAKQLLVQNSRLAIGANTYSRGDAGNISIETGNMSVINSQIGSITFARGNAGSIKVRATDSVEISGKIVNRKIENPAGLFAQVNIGGRGRGGNMVVEAKRLSVSNGGKVQVATFGQGDAGTLFIRASDIEIFNTPGFNNLFATGINSGVEIDPDETKVLPRGKGGELRIETERLSVRNGATVSSATYGEGNAGPLQIRALESIEVIGKSPDGNFKSQITASVAPNARGNGGELKLETGKMIVRDGGEVTVSNLGTGIAGNLEIQARFVDVDNQGIITATNFAENGGNIILQIQDLLLMRRGGKISTNAGTNRTGGDGGDIDINAKFIVAPPNDNSDITANAFEGSGGKVTINANGIFGLKPLSRQEVERLLQTTDPTKLDPSQLQTSDITAISQTNPSLNGEINLNTPDTDPNRGIAELPSDIVDVAGLINQNLCVASTGSQFTITGRGGVSPSPYELLSTNIIWEDWWISEPYTTKPTITKNSPRSSPEISTTIIEAQGWFTDANGNVILTAKPVTVAPNGTWLHPLNCQTGR